MKISLERVGSKTAKLMGQSVEVIARATKFVQRESPLTGLIFLKMMVFGCIEKPTPSLNHLAQVCTDLGIEISTQGIDQRITERAVAFLRRVFSQAMEQFKNQIPLPIEILQQFNGIYLTDSSVIPLPDWMAEDYPGCGGKGPQASLKIQLVFEFLMGNLAQIALCAGRDPDQGYREYIKVLEKGSLSITDLGYFALDGLKAIMYQQQAYFLSRFRTQTGLLTPAKEPIHLLTLVRGCPRIAFECNVLMGKRSKHRLPCRLIMLPVPQEVADERRRKAKAKARVQKSTVRKERLALMSWTFFVTNVPPDMLTIKQIATLYRVRWQIELVFKLWKSYCGLRRVADCRRERVLVELYAKLIGVVLTHFLIAPLRMPKIAGTHREISPVKVRHIFQRFARDLSRCLDDLHQFQKVLSNMLTHIKRFGFREKRKKTPSTCRAIALVAAMCGPDVTVNQRKSLA